MFGRHKSKEDEVHGEAIVTKADSRGGIAGEGGTSAIVWHLGCRLYLSADHSVDFEDKVGSAFRDAGDLVFNVGDTVPVTYHPDHPEDAKVDEDAIRTARRDRRAKIDAAQLAAAEQKQVESLRDTTAPDESQLTGCHLVVSDVIVDIEHANVLGTVRGGTMHVGDVVTINYEHPTTITGISIFMKPVNEAKDGQTVGITLASVGATDIFKNDVVRQA